MSGEKTEQPTSKKLRDARKKGQVAKSTDVSSTALLIVIFAIFLIGWPWMFQELQELMVLPARFYDVPFEEAMPQMLGVAVTKLVVICMPFIGAVIVFGVMVNYFQVGPLFVGEPIKPELKKINPIDKAKQMFSMKNLMEFGKSVIKVTFLGFLLFILIRASIPNLMTLGYGSIDQSLDALGTILFQLAIYTVFAYTVIAFADFGFQRWQHNKQLMMTKDEVKREFKESEGDPIIKGKRKQLHQEMVMEDSVQKTKKSTVLITNPTHRAIAVYYKEGETKLPMILAKAEGALAKRMMEVAKEEGIPIMQNIPLATDLFFNAQADHYIPTELIQPIAEVLRWVYELQQEHH